MPSTTFILSKLTCELLDAPAISRASLSRPTLVLVTLGFTFWAILWINLLSIWKTQITWFSNWRLKKTVARQAFGQAGFDKQMYKKKTYFADKRDYEREKAVESHHHFLTWSLGKLLKSLWVEGGSQSQCRRLLFQKVRMAFFLGQ